MEIIFEHNTITEVARKLLEYSHEKVFCFYGPMGVGKTTLIKAIVKELEAIDSAKSPTFSMVNTYENTFGEVLAYHFDFYRIENEMEAYDIGIEDYFNSNAYLFIEWPEKIPNLLPAKHQKVFLQFIDETTRSINF